MASYVEILTSHGITQKQWDTKVYYEYLRKLFWFLFMGKEESAIIQVKTQLQKGKGDTIVFELVGELQGGTVLGNATGIGNEGSFDIFIDSVTIDNVKHLVRIDDIEMSQQRSGLDLLNLGKSRLTTKQKVYVDEAITAKLSDRTSGRVQGRYLYGKLDSNWDTTHATALDTIDNTDDQLTLKSISKAKRKARYPGSVDLPKIMPTMVQGNAKRLVEWFLYVGHGISIRDLVENDATFTNRQLNIPPEPNSKNPLYTGSSFKGSHDGVLIHEYDGILLEVNTNSVQCAHNLLLGAQAAAWAIGQGVKFDLEYVDHKHVASMEVHEIFGIEKLVFNTPNAEDHSVVHHYTAAVDDA